MTSDNRYVSAFAPLWNDLRDEDSFPAKRPLLAHYTSIGTLEQIMRNDEVWFSNPLFMNDHEELRFGVNEGAAALLVHSGLKQACGSDERHQMLVRHFTDFYRELSDTHAFDIYVLCFSEHEKDDNDGRLSMWRGYGGNGGGAAVVFDSAAFKFQNGSPLIVANVTYLSTADRRTWIQAKLDMFADLLVKHQVPTTDLHIVAKALLERFTIFALFTKHKGFEEEREWRIVYRLVRDSSHLLDGMLGYFVGPRGLEPKLKFKVRPIEGLTNEDMSLNTLVERIILGPTVSNPLSLAATQRMLHHCSKADLVPKLITFTTPYRLT